MAALDRIGVLLVDADGSAASRGVVVETKSVLTTLFGALVFGIELETMPVADEVVTLVAVITGGVVVTVVRLSLVDVAAMTSPTGTASVAAELIGRPLDAAGMATLLAIIGGIAVGSVDVELTTVVGCGARSSSGKVLIPAGDPLAGGVIRGSAVVVAGPCPPSIIGGDEGRMRLLGSTNVGTAVAVGADVGTKVIG